MNRLKALFVAAVMSLGILPVVAVTDPAVANASSPYGCWKPAVYGGFDQVCFQIASSSGCTGACVAFMQGEVDNLSSRAESWSSEVHGPSGYWAGSLRSGTVGAYPGKAPWVWPVGVNMIAGPYYVHYVINGVAYNTPSYNVA